MSEYWRNIKEIMAIDTQIRPPSLVGSDSNGGICLGADHKYFVPELRLYYKYRP